MNLTRLNRWRIRHGKDPHTMLCGPTALAIVTGLSTDAMCAMLDVVADEDWREGEGGNYETELAEVLHLLGYDVDVVRRAHRDDLCVRAVFGKDDEPHFVVTQSGMVRDGAYFKGKVRPVNGCGLRFGEATRKGYYVVVIKAEPADDVPPNQAWHILSAHAGKGEMSVRVRDRLDISDRSCYTASHRRGSAESLPRADATRRPLVGSAPAGLAADFV